MDRLLRIRAEILATIQPLPAEQVTAGAARGRWLAAAALARVASPPHTCAAMDGYAVRAADVTGAAILPVRQTVYAGDVPAEPLAAGEAARIFTGATLPAGADAVVREEVTREEHGRVQFRDAARPGENVRRAGEDVEAGGVALPAGVRVGARQAALLAAVGVTAVSVRARPRVAVISTGDEVVSGRTPDSNGPAIAALVSALGGEPLRRSAGDRLEAVEAAIAAALRESDAVLTIGGVSIGVRDLVPAALERLGADVRVHGVPMKPGKPFLFARAAERPVLGLPGSPSACLVAFEVFARPALLALAGAARTGRRAVPLRLAEATAGKPGRARLLWAAVEPDGRVRPVGRDAAQVRGPALADALVCLPSGAGDLPEGAEVTTWLLDDDAG
ncbi:molybdopterin molybdotransferase MoeA [Anaeromyxobacter oryzae]|uniref:Molybdopterin molybdenumtransferase n=1 Tax=Anaeromyxobacter oryzae TaxID=2918170 RepID=A0ABM7X381_9BACT|nr:gephyrin-like molybdotransferase Glp [Anaeromyxobacter oryzae]BDG06253.1 molybdopterin molybdenumtransferase MoeA [Anaeromyxobacter oryzae]